MTRGLWGIGLRTAAEPDPVPEELRRAVQPFAHNSLAKACRTPDGALDKCEDATASFLYWAQHGKNNMDAHAHNFYHPLKEFFPHVHESIQETDRYYGDTHPDDRWGAGHTTAVVHHQGQPYVVDWSLRQFDPGVEHPHIEPLDVYETRFGESECGGESDCGHPTAPFGVPGPGERTAMPQPMPKGITFHYHPTDDTIAGAAFRAPAVEARHQGKRVGYLQWDGLESIKPEYREQYRKNGYSGKISDIKVHKDYRRHGIATSMFDFAKQHEPNLRHSEERSPLGEKWVRHEQSRHARRTAMPDEDYRGSHRPGGPDHGAPFHDLNQMWGEDIYDHPEWYDSMDYGIKNIQRQLNQARGNPDHPVVIYRALPPGVTDINTGDWVTTSLPYARAHAVQSENPEEDLPIVRSTVPAKHVWTNNDLHEWGYHGPNVRGEVVHSDQIKKARIMTAAVTVYTKPSCPQCDMTKKLLDRLGVEHTTVDVTADPDAHAYVTGLGYQQAPVVVVGDGEAHWGGFRPDHLKGLVSGE